MDAPAFTTALPPVLDAALAYAARGWPVLPVHGVLNGRCTCGTEHCASPGKHPITARGVNDATADPDRVRARFDGQPRANIGIATGDRSGIIVLDIDRDKGGDESLRDLEAEYGPLPATARTSSLRTQAGR